MVLVSGGGRRVICSVLVSRFFLSSSSASSAPGTISASTTEQGGGISISTSVRSDEQELAYTSGVDGRLPRELSGGGGGAGAVDGGSTSPSPRTTLERTIEPPSALEPGRRRSVPPQELQNSEEETQLVEVVLVGRERKRNLHFFLALVLQCRRRPRN